MKKKIFLILSITFLCIIVRVNAMASEVYDDDLIQKNFERVNVATKIQKELNNYYNISDIYFGKYPSYFGGMYVTNDATNLVIQIVRKNIPNQDSDEYKIYNKIVNMDNSVKVEYVSHSFNELNEVNNNIADTLFKDKDTKEEVTASYIDIMNNNVTVEVVSDNSLQKIKSNESKISTYTLSPNFNSDIVKFTTGKKNETFTDIKAGGYISAKNGGSCSMAMRVKYKGKVGFLTAGHCTNGKWSSIQSGSVKVSQFANNKNYDYAFIQTNSSYNPTNKLAYTASDITYLGVVDYCPTITANMITAKVGNATKYTTGRVTKFNISVTYKEDKKTIKGLFASNVYAAKGDSGGVFIIPRSDANGGAIAIGILSGGNGNETYFTSINSLPSELQNRY